LFIGNQTFVGTDLINLTLGQTYGGGKVFYLTSNYALIIDQSDLSNTAAGTKINSASGSSIGTGEANTLEIVNNTSVSETNAARLSYNSTNGGYSDWFLPSVDELVTAVQSNYANLNTGFYWTSTVGSFNYQLVRNDGYVNSSGDNVNWYVRAIRQVNLSSSASLSISGSLNVSKGITGSISATNGVVSSSNQITNFGFVTTSSFNTYTSSNDSKVNSLINKTGSFATTSSLSSSGNIQISGYSIAITASDVVYPIIISASRIVFTGSVQVGTGGEGFHNYGTSKFFEDAFFYKEISSPTINKFLETSSFNSYTASVVSVNTGSFATTGSNQFNGNQSVTGSLNVSGSLIVTGSARGNVVPITIVSSTASLDMTSGSYFTLTLANTTNTHIRATSITPGVNATLLVTTGTNSSASLSPLLLQPSGSSYTASLGSGKKDVLSLVAFDSTNMYVVSTKAMQ
jgi:hypothetical protein